MKMVEALSGMTRTYTFVFDPDPEGGFVVTCPALPGLVTHGATIEEGVRLRSNFVARGRQWEENHANPGNAG